MLFCLAGTLLLVVSVVLCIFADNDVLWMLCLIIGEIIAFLGYAPIIFKTLQIKGGYSAHKGDQYLQMHHFSILDLQV